jgi:hypothetical protein
MCHQAQSWSCRHLGTCGGRRPHLLHLSSNETRSMFASDTAIRVEVGAWTARMWWCVFCVHINGCKYFGIALAVRVRLLEGMSGQAVRDLWCWVYTL